jgi:hypothetical protein
MHQKHPPANVAVAIPFDGGGVWDWLRTGLESRNRLAQSRQAKVRSFNLANIGIHPEESMRDLKSTTPD